MSPRKASTFGAAAAAIAIVLSGCASARVAPAAPATAPAFSDYVFPAVPAELSTAPVLDLHRAAWQALQSGDPRAADRDFAAILKQAPGFYPADVGAGYSALARKDAQGAVSHFDKALARAPAYAPALAGKGDALLSLGKTDLALQAFEGAMAADASLAGLRSRVDVLKLRGAQETIANARKAADAGHFDEARAAYLAAIAASPESPFLYRELAGVESKAGDNASALVHAGQAATLDPTDVRALTMIAELHESNKEWTQAADAYAAVNAAEGSTAMDPKIDAMRERAAFETMPDEFRSIDAAPSVTRAQLAALLAVRLGDLLRRARTSNTVLITDTRGNWAAPYILAVARAGVIEAFPNHTFQPSAPVRRGDLAQAVSRVLSLIGAEQPKLAAKWREARPKFTDIGPAHLSYPAAARAVAAGVMAPLEDGAFQLNRPVSGAEALDVASKLAALAKK